MCEFYMRWISDSKRWIHKEGYREREGGERELVRDFEIKRERLWEGYNSSEINIKGQIEIVMRVKNKI